MDIKTILTTLLILAVWIHVSPQVVFFYRAFERAERDCETYYVHWKFSPWSLRFHDVYSECDRYKLPERNF